jgi:hypothetical protein
VSQRQAEGTERKREPESGTERKRELESETETEREAEGTERVREREREMKVEEEEERTINPEAVVHTAPPWHNMVPHIYNKIPPLVHNDF